MLSIKVYFRRHYILPDKFDTAIDINYQLIHCIALIFEGMRNIFFLVHPFYFINIVFIIVLILRYFSSAFFVLLECIELN